METIRRQISESPATSPTISEGTPLEKSGEVLVTPVTSDYMSETGLVDDFHHDTYDGPNLDSPPAYEP
jgi:hypothetical protein